MTVSQAIGLLLIGAGTGGFLMQIYWTRLYTKALDGFVADLDKMRVEREANTKKSAACLNALTREWNRRHNELRRSIGMLPREMS
jgi:hypothetical protein